MEYKNHTDLSRELAAYGARDIETCMQCGNCSAACPLSQGTYSFPRKIYRYLQLGHKDKLLASTEPWLCYYCGDCNIDCPRGAEPAETMMAARRWLTAHYDWTGLAKKFYLSAKWEFGALGAVALFIILLFMFGHGPMLTDHVSVNTFAPVLWIEIGDLAMAALLSALLLSNAFRMARFVMAGTKIPLTLYVAQAHEFVIHFLTQKRWRKCGTDRSRWLKHFLLVSGYLTMMLLIIVFIRWFQVDGSNWHFTSIFGYYAIGVLLWVTVEMFRSRLKKKESIHRFSELSDWLFLILLFLTAMTGIIMHIFRLVDWPMGTYVMYVIHLAIAVPMLVIEVPFGKWSHLFYRPLAIFLTAVKERSAELSHIRPEEIRALAAQTFANCIHCGACTSVCPQFSVNLCNPRLTLRYLMLGKGTQENIDQSAWDCVTCNACSNVCPRGIDIVDVLSLIRRQNGSLGNRPAALKAPLTSLQTEGNPWQELSSNRTAWAHGLLLPFSPKNHEFCLFTCCTTAYETSNRGNGSALIQLFNQAGISFGSLGNNESCCGDLARQSGDKETFNQLKKNNSSLFKKNNVKKIVTTSPHCLYTFSRYYPDLKSFSCEHYTTLLDRLVSSKQIISRREIRVTVTYHDPCYLSRHIDNIQAPRRILKQIPGLSLVEMAHTGKQSLCCGGGGSGVWTNGATGEQCSSVRRIHEALATGASEIITSCPYCIRMLKEAILDMGVWEQITVRDLADILLESITEKENKLSAVHKEQCHG